MTYLDEGVHQISLPNGAVANVYASPYTPEFWDWAFPYQLNEDRFNRPEHSLEDAENVAVNPMPSRSEGAASPIDIVMTHGPPWKRLDPTDRVEAVGCPHLLRALMRTRPALCCFGHIHEGWGAERVSWSNGVEGVVNKTCSIEGWKGGAWEEGVKHEDGVIPVQVDLAAARENRAVFVDVSESSGDAIRPGKETLFVNAAIMDVKYRPVNAPWVVDLDLPRK